MSAPSSRRGFLATLAGAVAGLGTAEPASAERPAVHRWGMVIDLDRCTGCQACAVACRAENNVPVAGPTNTERGRSIFWMNLLTMSEGEYPDLRQQFFPAPCNHCEDPPCIKVCPVGATTQSALRRIGQPDEMAGAVVYFASAASSFTTGQTIVLDGGQLV